MRHSCQSRDLGSRQNGFKPSRRINSARQFDLKIPVACDRPSGPGRRGNRPICDRLTQFNVHPRRQFDPKAGFAPPARRPPRGGREAQTPFATWLLRPVAPPCRRPRAGPRTGPGISERYLWNTCFHWGFASPGGGRICRSVSPTLHLIADTRAPIVRLTRSDHRRSGSGGALRRGSNLTERASSTFPMIPVLEDSGQ